MHVGSKSEHLQLFSEKRTVLLFMINYHLVHLRDIMEYLNCIKSNQF